MTGLQPGIPVANPVPLVFHQNLLWWSTASFMSMLEQNLSQLLWKSLETQIQELQLLPQTQN